MESNKNYNLWKEIELLFYIGMVLAITVYISTNNNQNRTNNIKMAKDEEDYV